MLRKTLSLVIAIFFFCFKSFLNNPNSKTDVLNLLFSVYIKDILTVFRTKSAARFFVEHKTRDISRHSKQQQIYDHLRKAYGFNVSYSWEYVYRGVHEPFSTNDGVYITTGSDIMKFSCIGKLVNSIQTCSSTGRAIYQVFQLFETIQVAVNFQHKIYMSDRYVT